MTESATVDASLLSGEEWVERPESLQVRILSGKSKGQSFRLAGKKTFSIGRGEGNDVRIPDPSVSTSHADLTITPKSIHFRDRGSRNGSKVGAVVLERGDFVDDVEVTLGKCRLWIGGVQSARVPLTKAPEYCGIVGQSQAMRELFARAERLAKTPLSTLLLGETGTGKELFARALHHRSGRRGSFVVLNCAALPEQLAESEILGHAKGAFTGASSVHVGVFERADQGTLFLDEIGELPPAIQPKLLRVLQERVVMRVGDATERPVNVRVVAATHRDLGTMISDGDFRRDLYERLCGAILEIPPLRDRREDIPLLAARFVQGVAKELGRPLRLTPGATQTLVEQPWSGNVRGLMNCVVRAAYLAESPPQIDTRDLDLVPDLSGPRANPPFDESLLHLPFREATARHLKPFQREFVLRALERNDGAMARTAEELRYSRKGLRELMSRLGIAKALVEG